MSSNSKLYTKVVLSNNTNVNLQTTPTRMYKGFSTVSSDTNNFCLYDFNLIKQDLLNHFNIRQGERLMNPTFGTIIWELLFEPLTDQVKNLILQNVNEIINYDPRLKANSITITSYETGLQLECSVTYVPYNISQAIQLKFDQVNGLVIH